MSFFLIHNDGLLETLLRPVRAVTRVRGNRTSWFCSGGCFLTPCTDGL